MPVNDELDAILSEFADLAVPEPEAVNTRSGEIPVVIHDPDFVSYKDFASSPPAEAPLPKPLLAPDEDDASPLPAGHEHGGTDPFVDESSEQLPLRKQRASGRLGIVQLIFAFIMICLSLFAFCWTAVNLHPDTVSTAFAPEPDASIDLVSKLSRHMNNVASDVLGELVYIPKLYSIEENVLVAPKPDQSRFGATTDPQVIQDVIAAAAELLGGQETVWSPDIQLYDDEQFHYYLDDTILALAWKEEIDGRICSFSEVKIADGSQLRRKIADDSYGSSIYFLPSDLAKQVNAVVAINGDFYTYRDFGITVYQRKLYRFENRVVDTCFFTASGDMLFTLRDQFKTQEEAEQFVKDNDVVFSVAFGPVLVDNGEQRMCVGYALGEVFQRYSRSAIGMTDKLHYLLMTINFEDNHIVATINEEGKLMLDKGCIKAYALDGGQTSTLVFNGSLINRVDYNDERTMSDIIYFATAIPESEVGP